MDRIRTSTLMAFLFFSLPSSVANSATLTLVNECTYTVWPGILSGAGIPNLSTTGFVLQSGNTTAISAPSAWSGRIWGRTFCTLNATTNLFSCLTADCGTGTISCAGSGATPPATLAEFTLAGYNGLDFYDVSLVDGYNIPVSVVPVGGTGNCTAAGCYVDLNGSCPSSLQVVLKESTDGENVACRSACDAFGDAQYCCSGVYSSPESCKPTTYSKFFKTACPAAYSYAYDDATSIFTCSGVDYVITFCPTASASSKTSTTNNTVVVPAASSHVTTSTLTVSMLIPAVFMAMLTSYRLL